MNKQFVISFLCGVMLVAGTACKNENTPEDKTVQKRHLTIKMNNSAGAPIKKATITDQVSTLLAEWTAGDVTSFCNLSRVNSSGGDLIIGTMTAATSGVITDLNGDVICMADDYLAIVYPAADLASQSSITGDHPDYCKYTISLAGQDGTLSTLASTYHYVYGRAHVLSVTGTTAEAEMEKMQSLLTICKFSFVEKDNESAGALPINTLTISYGGAGSDAGKYPQSANVEVTNLTTNTAAEAVKVDGSTLPLTISAGGAMEVYVALLPEIAARIYNFTVTNDNGTYTGTAEAHLKKGEYVPTTGLKLIKQ